MSAVHSTTARVAVYFRMSRETQDKSIDRQRSEVIPLCQRQGYEIAAEEKDEGVSGSEVERRPGLQRLLALAKAKKIDGVVVDDLDRLARLDLLELGVLLSPLRKAGVWIESAAQGRMDYNDMAGRLMLAIGGEAKKTEQLATARRVLTSHVERARERQRPPLPKHVYGYCREVVPGEFNRNRGQIVPVFRLVPDGAKAEMVRSLFQWYADGYPLGWIVKELHRRAERSPGGSPWWHKTTIRKILANPIYVGRRAWGKTSSGRFFRQRGGEILHGNGSRKTEWHPSENWFTTDDTAGIIDPDLWDQVQRRLALGTPPTPSTEPGAFLLSGLLVCGRCGGTLAGSSCKPVRAKPGNFYVCANYTHKGLAVCVRNEVKEDWAVRQVVAELYDRLLLPERLEWFSARLEEKARERRSDKSLGRMRKAVAQHEAKLARCRSRLVEVSRDIVPEIEVQIRETRAALEAAQNELRTAESADPVRELAITVDAARKALGPLKAALEGGDRCLQKETLRGILAGVVIGAEPYQTTTGKTRHRARIDGIRLRPGSGLDILSMLSSSCWPSTP